MNSRLIFLSEIREWFASTMLSSIMVETKPGT